jgi:hypothetical protein
MEVIARTIYGLGPRTSSMLVKRMGLKNGLHRRTLESVGREFGVTRERIRQVVSRATEAVVKAVKLNRPDFYPSALECVRTLRVASLDEITSQVSNAGDAGSFDVSASIRTLLTTETADIVRLSSSGDLWGAAGGVTREDYLRVSREALRILRGVPTELEQVSVEIARSTGQYDDGWIPLIQKMLRASPGMFFVEQTADGECLFPSQQRVQKRRKAFVCEYIREQGVPIRASELFSAMQECEPELISDSPTMRAAVHALESLLSRDDRFSWAGRSTSGLREWGYASGVASAGAAAVELLRSAGRPLAIRQITETLAQIYRFRPGSIANALRAVAGISVARNSEGHWYAL